MKCRPLTSLRNLIIGFLLLGALSGSAGPSVAGVFQLTTGPGEPFIVVHPPGYDGTGGILEVRVCASSGIERMEPAIIEALEIWNDLSPSLGNCQGCRTWEEPEDPATSMLPSPMAGVLIHELGHCAFGLDHSNWTEDGNGDTSYSNTADAVTIVDGPDLIPGTSDDEVTPLPGARLVHWFRKSDNDPFVVDATVIDSSSYSRRIVDLMKLGHAWPSNANRFSGDLRGADDTQAVMYSGITRGQRFTSLAADDVNTVKFAGLFDIHYRLVPFFTSDRLRIRINSEIEGSWDVIFADGFESGTIEKW